jgi:hypothetical protein
MAALMEQDDVMERWNIWESLTTPDFITMRHADVQLETKYWKLLHTFEAEDRKEANAAFRDMGYEP